MDLAITLLSGFASGVLGSVVWSFGLFRGLRRVALRLSDVEERQLSLKGKKAAAARWDEDQWIKEVAKHEARPPVSAQRYDNDPRDLSA